jgi:filamentous hemagglutinin family protein
MSGSATITQLGNVTDIRQSSADVSIDWLNFSIGAQATVDFLQPSASAIAVNRIAGTSSRILGRLDANGQVYLIDPNGILFGPGAQVNVGGLVASALDASDSSLTGDSRSFAGAGTGGVTNEGTINAAGAGYVALLGNRVSNQGVITAQLGTVALGAGSAATLNFSGDRLIHLQVNQSTLDDLASNQQLIEADGGLVIMTAGAQRSVLASVVNNSGVLEARTVQSHNGTIELLGGMTAGTVSVGGVLDASAPDGGNGGFVETSAAHVRVANGAKVTTAAPKGLYGTWLIDPADFTVAPAGGDITGATLSGDLNSTNFTVLSSSGNSPVTGGGSGGNVNVNDSVSWNANTTLTLTAVNNVNVNGNITASGAAAGLAINPNTANGGETASGTGTLYLGAGASITLSGASAGISIATSSYTLGAGATINLPNVSPSSITALIIGGAPYTVINSLGTPASATGTDLQGINGKLSGDFALGSNIDASATSGWNSSGGTSPVYAGFAPIGTFTTPFTGTFDGLGHVISNLNINRTTTSGVGLFGYGGKGATIRNLGLTGDSIYGYGLAGGLVGNLSYGTVSNSYANGSVGGAKASVGGLIGYSAYSTVINSYATGNVSGTSSIGGLIGFNHNGSSVSNSYAAANVTGSSSVGGLLGANVGSVVNSYATGSVTAVSGADFVGGLVGYNEGVISNSYASASVTGAGTSDYIGGLVGINWGTVSNSYATGSVSGANYIGGLVGWNGSGAVGVSNSYATASAKGSAYVGGLIGVNEGPLSNSYATGAVSGSTALGGMAGYNSGAVTNSFWDITTSGQSTSAGGTGLTTAQMQTGSNLVGFAFTSTPGLPGNNWVIVDTNGTLNNAGGAAGATFPMLASEYSTTIDNAHQLQLMAMNLAASYTQGQYIDASATGNGADVWGTTGFAPIGNQSTPFSGTFNGLGQTLFGLTINLPSSNGLVGLFGSTAKGAVLQNVVLAADSVSSTVEVGGLVGSNYGTVSNSYATGTVTGTRSIGGLVGNNGGTITNSYATGKVSGSTYVGGLAGSNNGTVSNSFATGGVSGTTGVGGLVGFNESGQGAIDASNASGNVSGYISVGGLVGENYRSVDDSFATGTVTGTSAVGGLVGNNGTLGTVTGSYALGAVSGSGYVGGLVGENIGTVSGSFASGGVTGVTDVGGLVGWNTGTVNNSFATGNVSGTYGNVGGLVGGNYGGGLIKNSYATGGVSGFGSYGNIGGLVGCNCLNGTITNSYSTGSVSGAFYVGGLVGFNSPRNTISNSYATGTVSATDYVGGLVGWNYGTVSNSYSTGRVSGPYNAGGLVGSNYGGGTVSNSFWNVTTSGLASSAGGIGMTTANMQTLANFTAATSANGNVNPNWDFAGTWVMYSGFTYPLLRSFMTPVTVTANNAATTYNGQAYSGGNGITASIPIADLLGSVSYGGTSQGAANAGSYTITPAGLYSNQQGYIINFVSGTLTINQLASVAWIGGATGDWSTASNWAAGAIPDLSNVAAVTIPKGTTVTYDAGMSGTTILTSLTDNGKLVMAAGDLTTGNLTAAGYVQTGGTLDVGGTLSIDAKAGPVTLGNVDAGALTITAAKGAITQLAGTAIDVSGATGLTADNGAGGLDAVTLAQAGDSFGGAVTAEGSAVTLKDKTALTVALDSSGAATLTAAGALKVSGTVGTTLTTKTTGAKHATTFGATSVGTSLTVTSTGAVTETAPNTLVVAGEGTTTAPNPNVCVNGACDVKIPAP